MQDEWSEAMLDRIDKVSRWVNPQSMKRFLLVHDLESDYKKKLELGNELETILSTYESKFLLFERSVLAQPPSGKLQGELTLGTIVVGDEEAGYCKLPINSLTRHMILYAQTGHSKTTAIYGMTDDLNLLNVPFLWPDLKEDGRKLHRQYQDLIVIPWREFRWNPLRPPPGMDLKEWWQNFAQTSGRSWGTFHAGPNYLLEFLDELYVDYEKNGKIPNLLDLYQLIVLTKETSRKRLDYFDVVYNRLRTITSILGKMLNCEVGVPTEQLLDHQVILELNGLRTEEQVWLVEILLTWIYHYRLVQRHRSEHLRHVIILDECHRWFYAGKDYSETTREMGMPTMDTFPTQFRDFGEGLICTTNLPSRVSQSLHSNTLIKITGNLGSGNDVDAVAEAMGLNDEEKKIIHTLKRAEWIVKLSDYHTEPFMIVTSDHPVDTDVTDEEVSERMHRLLPMSEDREEKEAPLTRPISQSKQEFAGQTISDEAKALLCDIAVHPIRGVSKRYDELGLRGKKAIATKSELVEKNLVGEVEVTLGNYRPTKFLVPTASGIQLLKILKQTAKFWDEYEGNVSFEHRLYQLLITHFLTEAGYQVAIEKNLDRKRLDLLAIKDSKRIGVEIALNSQINSWNVLKAQKDLDGLIVVCKDRNIARGIENNLAKIAYPSVLKKISIRLLADYLNRSGQSTI